VPAREVFAPVGRVETDKASEIDRRQQQDIEAAREWFEGKGKRILGPTRIGAHGTPIFFLHPKDMMGQLTEIMEKPKEGAHWSN